MEPKQQTSISASGSLEEQEDLGRPRSKLLVYFNKTLTSNIACSVSYL
jgi:hypothetical protein